MHCRLWVLIWEKSSRSHSSTYKKMLTATSHREWHKGALQMNKHLQAVSKDRDSFVLHDHVLIRDYTNQLRRAAYGGNIDELLRYVLCLHSFIGSVVDEWN